MCYVGENGLVSWKIYVAILALLAFGYNFINKRRKNYSFGDYLRLIIFGKRK